MFRGVIYVLLSSLLFALSTVFAKLVHSTSSVPAVEITFFRFFAGFITSLVYVLSYKKSLKPGNIRYITYRAIYNTGAVILFFIGIQYTTVSKANLLNLTSPVFIFLLAPFLNRESVSPVYYLYLVISMIGIYMVLLPDSSALTLSSINMGDMASLASGLVAAFALMYLREARKYDPTYIILFYLMLIGSFINLVFVIPVWVTPRGISALYLALSTFCAVAGQYTVTEGYRYLSAAAGSIISSSRLVFAVGLGVVMFNDPLSERIIIGSCLVLLSLAGVSGAWESLRKKNYSDSTGTGKS